MLTPRCDLCPTASVHRVRDRGLWLLLCVRCYLARLGVRGA